MKQITQRQLVNLLRKLGGRETLVLVEAFTSAYPLKNPYGEIYKHHRSQTTTGCNYQKAVNQECIKRELDPKFVALPLRWGTWDVPNVLIAHNSSFYLRTQTNPEQRADQYVEVLGYYTATNRKLQYGRIKRYLKPPCEAGTQTEVGLYPARNQVWVRNYALRNIRTIVIDGVDYEVVAK